MNYRLYKGRPLTLWQKFFPPDDYDCGCGGDPFCVCGWWSAVAIGAPFVIGAVAIIACVIFKSAA